MYRFFFFKAEAGIRYSPYSLGLGDVYRDRLMSAEGFKIIAEEMIASYERIAELEKKLENR